MKKQPLVSICIPVYNTENYLKKCIGSVINQEFSDYEIIVMNDCSPGFDKNGQDCKKIVKSFRNKKIKYFSHVINKGLVETRRDLVLEACGKYIFMLDSDDLLFPQALKKVSEIVQTQDFDIVQGLEKSFYVNEGENQLENENNNKLENPLENKNQKNTQMQFSNISFLEKRKSNCVCEKIYGKEIFTKFFVENKISPFLWAKFIKREIYLDALEQITPTYCNVAEDLLQFFFITRLAKSYIGLPEEIYMYRINSGMTSGKKISKIIDWKIVCSTSSVFTILFNWINNQKENGIQSLNEEETRVLQNYSLYYICNNFKQMKEVVVPELQQKAYEILCDFWGESFVKRIEKQF